MTREQYESLKLADLKALAKTRDIKVPAGAKKEDIIELMLEKDHEEADVSEDTRPDAVGRKPVPVSAMTSGGDKKPRSPGRIKSTRNT